MRSNRMSGFVVWFGVLAVVVTTAHLGAQKAETFGATATVKTGATTASAPITVVIEKFATDAERTELMGAVKKGGTASAKALLMPRPASGSIQVGKQQTPIKYAFARSMGAGRLITIVTSDPISVAGSGLPDSKKAGFDLGLALLEVPASGTGQGELSPAAKVRVDDQGAIVTEDANASTVIRLSGISRK